MLRLNVVLILFLLVTPIPSQVSSLCGNWIEFKDEKCNQLYKHLTIYSDAETFCRTQDNKSTLAIIKSKEEQDAIEKLIKTADIADNVWIGTMRKNGSFKNSDQTQLDYTNWAEHRPLTNKTGLDCVELSTDETSFGKWIDEKCQKQNAVICQKDQPWANSKLQNMLLDMKRESDKQQERIVHLEQNPIPIGFIYVQLSGQNEPKTLWPNTQWENISPKLAGLFFRVEGGQAPGFGQIQEQQTEGLIVMCSENKNGHWNHNQEVRIGTEYILPFYTGASTGDNVYTYIKHTSDEIRPRNTAMKIWQRTK